MSIGQSIQAFPLSGKIIGNKEVTMQNNFIMSIQNLLLSRHSLRAKQGYSARKLSCCLLMFFTTHSIANTSNETKTVDTVNTTNERIKPGPPPRLWQLVDYYDVNHPVIGRKGMVVSQKRIASEIGADILRQGGNAIDAAVAVGFALSVVLPRAGNLAGGGFMLVHLAEQDKTIAIDYRETAPALAYKDLFLDEFGKSGLGSDLEKLLGHSSTQPPTRQGKGRNILCKRGGVP